MHIYHIFSTNCFFLRYRSSLHPTWVVNSQLQDTSALPYPRRPTPHPPPTPLTSLTQPIPLSPWALVKVLWAQLPRALDTPQLRIALLSGQDPQAHARSACLTLLSRYHSTSHLRQPRCPCTQATTWELHSPPRNQSAKEGTTWGPHSPVRPLV